MKKFFSVALAAMMVVSMTACGATNETPASTQAAGDETVAASTEAAVTEEAAESAAEDGAVAEGEGAALKIAIVSSPSCGDDGSLN